jgi:hypothetical protein
MSNPEVIIDKNAELKPIVQNGKKLILPPLQANSDSKISPKVSNETDLRVLNPDESKKHS